MSNANVSFLGQSNLAGDQKAIFLKVFANEVMTAYEAACVFLDKHNTRSISHGKSAQFPAIGTVGSEYHVPGTEILGLQIPHAEKVITIDDLLISHSFIANIDEAMNHYDVRSTYSKEMGIALATAFDKNVAQCAVLSARAANVVTSLPGGSQLTNANYRTNSDDLGSGLFAAAQVLDEKNIPSNDRYAFLLPAQYYLAVQNTTLINKDYAGHGSIAKGTIESVAGLTIVKTNHLPTTNITTGPAKYQGDFSNTAFLVMTKNAVGTVKLLDMAVESDYDIRRQGTLMVAKYAVGHDWLRPECAVEGKIA